ESASQAILGRPIVYSEPDLQRILSPAHFVSVRTTWGGPAPSETTRAIAESRRLLGADRNAWKARRDHLGRAEAALEARVKQL
ncbi:MAG: argininosuccinate lyase, partial [Acidobacteriota bacterium]|nr:argininosuccinate lyase [Acidobacteriota bacterium]